MKSNRVQNITSKWLLLCAKVAFTLDCCICTKVKHEEYRERHGEGQSKRRGRSFGGKAGRRPKKQQWTDQCEERTVPCLKSHKGLGEEEETWHTTHWNIRITSIP